MSEFILRILRRLKLVRAPSLPTKSNHTRRSIAPQSQPTSVTRLGKRQAEPRGTQAGHPFVEAAHSIYDTADEEHEEVIISPPPATGKMTSKVERWDITEQGRRNTQQNHKVVSASGAVVHPENLKSICSCCQAFSDDLVRSTTSGLPLCTRCRIHFDTPNGTEVLTEFEYQRALEEYDTWTAARHHGPKWKKFLRSSNPNRFRGRQ